MIQIARKVSSACLLAASAWLPVAHANTYNLGGQTTFLQSFQRNFTTDTGAFTDYYTFNFAFAGSLSGVVDAVARQDLDVVSLGGVTLRSGDLSTSYGSGTLLANGDASYAFNNLSSGLYTLVISGTVTPQLTSPTTYSTRGNYILGYVSTVTPGGTTLSNVASPAPEASSIAMMLMGLGGVVALLRHRTRATRA